MAEKLHTNYFMLFRKYKDFIAKSLMGGMSVNELAKVLSEKEGHNVSNQCLRLRIKTDFYIVKQGCTYKSVMLRGDVVKGVEMPQPNQCKFILDDWTLCQSNIERGSYCEKHYQICYKKDSYKKCVKE